MKLIFDNDAIFDAAGAITGTGNVTLVRIFNRSGWQNVSFPVKSTTTKTLGDVVKSGEAFNYTSPKTPQTNIFYWDLCNRNNCIQYPVLFLAILIGNGKY